MKFIRFFLISLLAGFIVSVYLIYSEKGSWLSIQYLPKFALAVGSVFILSWVIDWQSRLVQKIFPRPEKSFLHFTSRFLLGCFSIFLFYGFPILWWFSGSGDLKTFISGHIDTSGRMVFVCLLGMLVYLIADFAFYSFRQYHQTVVQKIQCQAEQLNLQFEILKNQLSPHFLFNNLNTIYSLIHTNADKAELYIRELSIIFGYILQTHHQKTIALQDEINCIQSYRYLLEIRFDNAIKFHLNIDPDFLQWHLPPLSIQILVENAVKHNTFDRDKPLCISVSTKNNHLIVKNNRNPKSEKPESFQIGLENLQKRFTMLTTQKLEIKKDDHFTVSLPLISPKSLSVKDKVPNPIFVDKSVISEV